jgi:hypothetical protein
VGIPKGDYTVEARFDTGPSAGLLKDLKDISFDPEKVSE